MRFQLLHLDVPHPRTIILMEALNPVPNAVKDEGLWSVRTHIRDRKRDDVTMLTGQKRQPVALIIEPDTRSHTSLRIKADRRPEATGETHVQREYARECRKDVICRGGCTALDGRISNSLGIETGEEKVHQPHCLGPIIVVQACRRYHLTVWRNPQRIRRPPGLTAFV